MKQIIALEDSEGVNVESNFIAFTRNSEVNGSGWVYNRTAFMSTHLCKYVTKVGPSYFELFTKDFLILNFHNKIVKLCEIWFKKPRISNKSKFM